MEGYRTVCFVIEGWQSSVKQRPFVGLAVATVCLSRWESLEEEKEPRNTASKGGISF